MGTVTFLDHSVGRQKDRSLYDATVERWNALKAYERRERAAECVKSGHKYEPLSWGVSVCTRCLKYRPED